MALPITLFIAIMLDTFPETRWLASLMGIGDADDERWMIVDVAAHHDARFLVIGVCGQDYAASELVAQGLDGQARLNVCCGSIHGSGIVA